jgi:SsrA-binding protein
MAKSTSKPAAGAGKKPQSSNKKDAPPPLVCDNKKARFQYEILDTFECGLVLRGTEVKVLRQGRMSLDESYARLQDVTQPQFCEGTSHGEALGQAP